jgi:uncharacterized repeat protein (TIGR01451 family)
MLVSSFARRVLSASSLFAAACVAFALVGEPALAAASISSTTSFTPVDSARDAMDIGGVSDGTRDVTPDGTGDHFAITIANGAGATTAFDLTLSLTLPDRFRYIAGTAGDNRGIGVTATQVGQSLNFNLSGFDLAAGQNLTIDFDLTVDVDATAGTKNLQYLIGWGDSQGGSGNTSPAVQPVLVKAGAKTVTKTPSQQTAAVGATVSWTVTVTSTGLGGLFDVVIDESAIAPGASLSLTSITAIEPATGVTLTPTTASIPYLGTGERMVVQVTAQVTDCEDITNTARVTDRDADATQTATAEIVLDLGTAMLDFVAPAIDLNYDGTTRITMLVSNTPATMGTAFNVRLQSTLNSFPVTVAPVGPDWAYSGGVFALLAGGGTIADNQSVPLVFDLIPTGSRCSAFPGGSVVWTAIHENECDDSYKVPTHIGSIGGWNGQPSISLDKSASDDRLEVNEPGRFTLTADASNRSAISGSNLIVTDTLPSGITAIVITAPGGTSYDCGGDLSCTAGELLTWTIPLTLLDPGGPQQLTIDFVAPSDPCSGGGLLTNTASTSATTSQSCSLDATSSDTIYLGNNPETALQQSFNTQGSGGTFETGLADDGDGVREDNTAGGEAEFIPFEAQFVFDGSAAGSWTGSTYADDFGGLSTQQLVAGTLQYSINGGAFAAVPGANFSTAGNQLTINLSFLSGGIDNGTVAGDTLVLRYRTTVSDADLGSAATRSVAQKGTLTIAGGGGGCSSGGNAVFSQFALYQIQRADGAVTVSIPSEVTVCENFPVTISVENATAEQLSNLRVTLQELESNYTIDQSIAPVYGGFFASNPPSYVPTGPSSNPTWTLAPASQELTSSGTITVQMRRRAGTGVSTTPLTAFIEFDDNQTSPTTLTREFLQSGSGSPALVREADLILKTTPQTFTVTSNQASWVIYVSNTGNGAASNVSVTDQLPSALNVDLAATNAANPAYIATDNGSGLVSWSIPSIPAGATVALTLISDVNGSSCSPGAGNLITAAWGCGGVIQQTRTSDDPLLLFPAGQLQTLHDTTQTAANLCDNGLATIVVRNTGLPHVYDVTVSEDLGIPGSGLSIVPGSLRYSLNGGLSYVPALSEPALIGTLYSIGSAQVPELADLAPLGEAGGVATIYIQYDLASSETTNGFAGTINASSTATVACGDPVSSGGDVTALTINRPDITVSKLGFNVSNGGSNSETVFGGNGDTVRWQLAITNSGRYKAKNVRLVDLLPATGVTSATLTAPDTSTQTLSSNVPLAIAELAPNATAIYTLEHPLGSTCVDDLNTFDVTWGCNGALPTNQRANLSSPTDNTDTANLVMQPNYSTAGAITQAFTTRGGGRSEIFLTLRNDGGTANGLTITDTLPTGYVVDPSFAVVQAGSATLSSFSSNFANPAQPVFTAVGTILNSQTITIRFAILPNTAFDTAAPPLVDPEQPPVDDPTPIGASNNVVQVQAGNTCAGAVNASDSVSFDPRTPDIDISVVSDQTIVQQGDAVTVTFTLVNNGDTGSIADAIDFLSNIGAAWSGVTVTITTPGTGGTGGVCSSGSGHDCTEAQLGQLAAGQAATIVFTGTANDNEAASALLTLIGTTHGNLRNSAGTDTGNDYSFDAAQARIIGVATSKTLTSTSESFTSGSTLTIGEEATWTLRTRWFGAPSLSAVTVRDTLPAGLGFVSQTATANNTLALTLASAPTPVQSGVIDWSIAPFSGFGTFEVTLVTRVLNSAATPDNASLVNNLGVSFGAFSSTFASSDPDDGFGGNQADLHAEGTVTVRRPAISVDKQVRNVSNGEAGFSQTTNAIAGDLLQYRVAFTNTGGAAAIDLSLVDTLGPKLILIDGNADGTDNDGDGTIDTDSEGTYAAGAGGSVTFDQANTQIPAGSPSRTMAQLDPGETLFLIYNATVGAAANPLEALANNAQGSASSLPGASGNQTAPTGTPGNVDGELVIGAGDVAITTVQAVTVGKTLTNTAVGNDTSTEVVIGEQLEYSLQIVLPAGTVPNFIVNDLVPDGLALVRTPAVSLGSSVTGGQPTITPSAPPVITAGPIAVSWDFGTRLVNPGTEAERTVTIRYLTQVLNRPSNVEGTTLTNSASYSVGGVVTDVSDVTVTVREPSLGIVKLGRNITKGESAFVASPAAPDAGDQLEYQITITNSGSVSSYDLNIVDTLASGLSYLAGSTAGGLTTDPDVSGNTLTWGRTQSSPLDIDLAGSGTLTFTFQATVQPTVEPSQALGNSIRVDGTSLDGPLGPNLGDPVGAAGTLLGERTGADGTGGLNDYAATATSNTTALDPLTLLKSASAGTLGSNDFRVGDLVRYTLNISNLHEGTIDGLVVGDTLPTHLRFVRTVSIASDSDGSPWVAGAPLSYTALVDGVTAPAPGATGTIAWNFGTLVNQGDNDTNNNQLVIVYEAQVVNSIPATPATMQTNAATLDYQLASGAPATQRTAATTIDVLQPQLAIAKSIVSQPNPLIAGAVIRYLVTVSNSGQAPAYDVVVRDTLPDSVRDTLPTNFAYTLGGVAPGTPPTVDSSAFASTGVIRWLWPGSEPLAAGSTLTIAYDVTVDSDVGPATTITNRADVPESYSLPSTDPNAAGRKSYPSPVEASTSTSTVSPTDMQKSGPTTATIGELITYTLTIPQTPVGVTLYDVIVTDDLPANLVLVDVSNGPTSSGTGFDSSATNTATNHVEARYATVPANAQAVVLVRARVRDLATNNAGVTIDNTARYSYAPAPGGTQQTAITDSHTVTLVEPNLTMTKNGPATLDLGVAGSFTLQVANIGGAAAYQGTIVDTLPVGMRNTTPTISSIQVGAPARTLSDASPDDYDTSYNSATGLWTIALKSDAARIGASELLQIVYTAALDNGAASGDLTNSAAVSSYFSQSTEAGIQPDTRTYTNDPNAGTAADGDDFRADHTVRGRAPVITAIKSVSATTAQPGDLLTYTVVLSNSGELDATNVSFTDSLPSSFQPGTLAGLTTTSGTASADPNGGVNNTGLVTVTGITIPVAGPPVTIRWNATLRSPLPSGTRVLNQGSASVPGFDEPVLTDSSNAADDDNSETGNDPDDPNDDDPTATTIESRPQIEALKSALDENNGTLDPGDTILYTITLSNSGNEHARNVIVTDPIPSFTSYRAGSTTLNGTAVADAGGTSPLVAGLAVGDLDVDATVTITFRVDVNASAPQGSLISNQAFVSGEGEGSGPFPIEPSDDPSTPADDDPTVLVVGNRPLLEAQKLATDLNGGGVLPNDVILYTIDIRNDGAVAASNVSFTDPLPANTSFVPGSITLGGSPQTDAPGDDAAQFDGSVISATIGALAPNTTVRVTFQVRINAGTADGTVISNQGLVDADGVPSEATDDDGNDDDGDEPTRLVVGNLPLLRATKQVFDLNGGTVQAGDDLLYSIVIGNFGAAAATNVEVTDPVPPAPTTYISSSTTLDGAPQSDVSGNSPLVFGVDVGTLAPGASATIQYRVTIPIGTATNTTIENQANFTADGGITGVSDSDLDDGIENGNDPNDPNDDDPTRITIGARPGLASVAGNVWLDSDHDRLFDSNETGQGRWVVEILLDGQLVASTLTNPDGSWRIDGLTPGDGYQIRFRHPDTGVVWGDPVSNAPGATTANGTIENLTLSAGVTVLEQNLPLDPSGVVYDSIARTPVAGAVVTISGPPGFDPAIHLLPGQQGQTTAGDGFYRFDLIGAFPPGVYTISVVPPANYNPVWPSTIITPQTGSLDPTGGSDPLLVQTQNTPPQTGETTTYYISWNLTTGDPQVVNNHIPVDPILSGAVQLTKTTPRASASRGDLVPYTITAVNTLNVPLTGVQVVDTLPPGFKLVENSITVDGLPAEVVIEGRRLTLNNLTLLPGQPVVIKLIAVIGASVNEGVYDNLAVAQNQATGRSVSNTARASTRIVPDPTFDCTDVIGKVFQDLDSDGHADQDEPGVPHVRLVTLRGLLIDTDSEGRYHITCADVPNERRGSNFVVKLDERSLPTGYRMISENPRSIRLTRGKFAKLDFAVSLARVVRLELGPEAFGGGELLEQTKRTLTETLASLQDESTVLRLALHVNPANREPDTDEAERLIKKTERWLRGAWRDLQQESDQPRRSILFIEHELAEAAVAEGSYWTPIESSRFDSGLRFFELRSLRTRPVAPNQEAEPLSDGKVRSGSVTIEGVPQNSQADQQRRDDLALGDADLQVTYNPADHERKLNVQAFSDAAVAGSDCEFYFYANYWDFIDRAELRVLRDGDSPRAEPLAIVPMLDRNKPVIWRPQSEVGDSVRYVLRVYDSSGRFDETAPKRLVVSRTYLPGRDRQALERERMSFYGENGLAVRNLQVAGGTVTISGKDQQPGGTATALGQEVPVDPNGRFAIEAIVPSGERLVEVSGTRADGSEWSMQRKLYTPQGDWFFIGLADLTVSKHSIEGQIEAVGDDERLASESTETDGRLAFYLKGRIKGSMLLTAALDTRETELSEIFSSIGEKDPRQLLRRLDPDRYYPIYGDDSTTIEDAPTIGKLYLRLENQDARFLWGNFQTKLNDVELAQIDRGLYGANYRYGSPVTTSHGERRLNVDLFVAEPETVSAQDVFRGTGGSVYHLSHRDLTIGSERVRIETRDKDSDIVLSVAYLAPNSDYDIDYIQGRILLTRPLPSNAGDDSAVNDGRLPGNPNYLVVRYEYQSLLSEDQDLALGGRISGWVGEHLQLGVTGSKEPAGTEDQRLQAVDLTWRKTPETYLRLEAAQTEGPGRSDNGSFDGGFFFESDQQTAASDDQASAFRIESAFRFGELFGTESRARGRFYWQERDRGYSAASQFTPRDTTQRGLGLDLPMGTRTTLRVHYDERDELRGIASRAAELNLDLKLSEKWWGVIGVRGDEWDSQLAGSLTTPDSLFRTGRREGRRVDGAFRLGFKPPQGRWDLYGIVQGTIDRTGQRSANNRYGFGGTVRLNERFALGGEVTGGNGGVGGKLQGDYRINDRTTIYLGYLLDTDRSDDSVRGRNGSLVTGVKNRFSDHLSLFGEGRYLHGERSGLTHAFGLDYAPTDAWTLGTTLEKGTLRDQLGNEVEREAAGFSAGKHGNNYSWQLAIEARNDQGFNTSRTTWLGRTSGNLKLSPDWRGIIKLNFSRSHRNDNGPQTFVFDGDFSEFILGAAHRPVKDDRWNTLFKFTYFMDLPTPNQRGRDELRLDFQQRSTIFSIDTTFAGWQRFSLGGKFALRSGGLRANREKNSPWFQSDATLAIVRGDWHVIHKWDAVLEARALKVDLAEETRRGWLLGLYRQLGRNLKLGVGYNFTDFSDDLTDLDYDDEGFFLNVLGKF